MREDDLTRDLAEARDALPPADEVTGREAVDRRVEKHQRQRIAAVLTVVVLLAVGGAIGLARTGVEQQGLVTTPGGEALLPRIVPTDVPESWELQYIDDGAYPTSATTGVPSTATLVALWSSDLGASPRADSKVALVIRENYGSGFDGLQVSAGDGGPPRAQWEASYGSGEFTFTLLARNVDEESVRSWAEEIRSSSGGVPGPPPGFYDVLAGREFRSGADRAGPSDLAQRDSYTENYRDSDYEPGRSVGVMDPSITVARARPIDRWLSFILNEGTAENLRIHDRDAVLREVPGGVTVSGTSCGVSEASQTTGSEGTLDAESCTTTYSGYELTLAWSPTISVEVIGATADDVRRVALGLVEVDAAQWQDFLASSQVGTSTGGTPSATVWSDEGDGSRGAPDD